MTDQSQPDRQDGEGLQIELLPRSVSQDEKRVSVHFDFGDSAAAAAFRIKVAFRIEDGDFAVRFNLATQPTRDGAEGAGEHAVQCHECGETVGSNEDCDLPECPRKAAPPKPTPDAMREGDDLDRPLFFEPSGDGMRACIHDADGYIFCEANYDDFKDNPSFPERVMERLVKRAYAAPVPPADEANEDALTKLLDEAWPDGHREAARKILSRFAFSPSGAGAAEPVAWRKTLSKIKRLALDVKPEDVPLTLAYIARLCIDAGSATPDQRNWIEDASHENGNYECMCCECDQMFIGHKRRVVCKACSKLFATPPVRGDREIIRRAFVEKIRLIPLERDDPESVWIVKPESIEAFLDAAVQPGAGEREVTAQDVMDSRNKQFGFAWDLNEAICDAIDGGKTESRDIAARVTTNPKIKKWLKLLPALSRQVPHSSSEGGR